MHILSDFAVRQNVRSLPFNQSERVCKFSLHSVPHTDLDFALLSLSILSIYYIPSYIYMSDEFEINILHEVRARPIL